MILEEYIFTSCFLNDIQGLIEQKKQSGYIYDSAKYILIQFDKFCVENHIDRAIITKELSDTWQSYHADEAKSRRATVIAITVICPIVPVKYNLIAFFLATELSTSFLL